MLAFLENTLEETVASTNRLAGLSPRPQDLSDWLRAQPTNAPISSNQGAAHLPFQRWFRFKEAFSPSLVASTIASVPYRVQTCLDPFGGSGTTALTCRFLGIDSATIELNPFFADLIEAKLTSVVPTDFLKSYERLVSEVEVQPVDREVPEGMPTTFREPGIGERYVFGADVYDRIRALARTSDALEPAHSRLIRILIGSVLVENSNIIINGKGRRYRRGWQNRPKSVDDFQSSLDRAVDLAVADLTRFGSFPRACHRVLRGDARQTLAQAPDADIAIFSPPYPNSFDYTDVYNVELWMLGYLQSREDNRSLRKRTFRSHVQIKWESGDGGTQSPTLNRVVDALNAQRAELWNPNIPGMLRHYFADMQSVMREIRAKLRGGRHAFIVIGDSQYAGIHVDVAQILSECAGAVGFRMTERKAIRSMRNSSQHGGKFALSEHCLMLEAV